MTKAHLLMKRIENFSYSACRMNTTSVDTKISMTTRSTGVDSMQFSSSFVCDDNKKAEIKENAVQLCSHLFAENSLYDQEKP